MWASEHAVPLQGGLLKKTQTPTEKTPTKQKAKCFHQKLNKRASQSVSQYFFKDNFILGRPFDTEGMKQAFRMFLNKNTE